MLQTIVGALLPVVFTILLGVLAGWRGDEDMKGGLALNKMVLVYALPLVLFTGTATTSRAALAAELPLAAALTGGLVVPFALAWLAARYVFKRDGAVSALEAMALGFPATTLVGFAVLTPLVGDRTTAVVAWCGIIDNIIVLPTTLVLISLAQGDERTSVVSSIGNAIWNAVKEPVVFAPLLAIAFVIADVKIPGDVISAMKLLGATTGGVSLFSSGVILQAQRVAWSWPAAICAVARTMFIPLIVFVTMTALHADAELRRMVVLALALASGPIQLILSVRYDVNRQENATILLMSNLLSIPGLAFFIWLTT